MTCIFGHKSDGTPSATRSCPLTDSADSGTIDAMSIYVETRLRAPLEDLWEYTQNPERHERWDLRFSRIEYLSRLDDSEPQRFLYSTRIGLGLAIRGEGESVGEREAPGGTRNSSLRFWSNDPKSLIREGSGYWKYIPTGDGVRFLTLYRYDVRFGWIGRYLDRAVFQPLMGWATAWSFDRLRLWLEDGLDPSMTRDRTVVYAAARCSVACVWIYHGLVPKLLFTHSDERLLLGLGGVSEAMMPGALVGLGLLEVVFGFLVLFLWNKAWPLITTVVAMLLATVGVAATAPSFFVAAFNPVSLNLLVAVSAIMALLTRAHRPSARSCLRREPHKS